MALDHDLAGLVDLRFQHRVLAQPPHQHAGAPIDETFGQPLVQRVGEPVLDGARYALPMLGIGQPIRTVGRKRPGADMGDAGGKGVDIAVRPVGLRDLAGEPVGVDLSITDQVAEHRDDQLGMVGRRDLAIIGNLADVPQPLDVGAGS